MDLNELREEINAIDKELVRLFTARMNISAKIADYKKQRNLPIFVPAREQEVLQKVTDLAGPEMADYTRILYSTLFELSRNYQSDQNSDTSVLQQNNKENSSSCTEVV